eukprot:g12115.t1
MSIGTLTDFYRCTTESTLSRFIMAWYGNCSAQDCKKLQEVVCTAQTITEAKVPSMDSIYISCCHGRAAKFIKDPTYPSNALLQPLPSGRRLRNLNTCTSRFKNSFFPAIIRLM